MNILAILISRNGEYGDFFLNNRELCINEFILISNEINTRKYQ